eukprot:NODE_104_length_1531_cov_293.564103_g71_i1.p1 GENE.NODE_104_length_1531_cov_293.564103_g71_i1~~NODE_104_length_1531_cov_293.564103_g71_i1.p1  ORF type:complete len:136 (+),score=52.38 NODE_104_length_1531_cov_293.564103_g71_i1:537-944(+)
MLLILVFLVLCFVLLVLLLILLLLLLYLGIAVLLFVLSHIPGGVSICSSSSSLITPAICSSDPSSLRDVPLSSLDSLISRFLHLPLPFSSLSPLYSPFHSLSPLFPPRRRSSCVPVEGAHGEFLCFLSACPSRAY